MERARSDNLAPALIASAVLHVGGFAAGFIVWPHTTPAVMMRASSTPVTIVTSAPIPDVRPAVEADVQETAATPDPVPEAAPQPPAPVQAAAAPAPVPPKPAAKPKPALDLDALAANLPKARPQPRRPALDLEALSQSATRPQPRSGPTIASAEKGPARAETDLRARPAVGAAQGLSGSEIDALRAKLIKLWNPNCGVEGAANVVIRVEMRLTPDGRVIESIDLDQGRNQGNSVLAAASARALTAVARGQPYSELSHGNYAFWRDIVFKFDAREACR